MICELLAHRPMINVIMLQKYSVLLATTRLYFIYLYMVCMIFFSNFNNGRCNDKLLLSSTELMLSAFMQALNKFIQIITIIFYHVVPNIFIACAKHFF